MTDNVRAILHAWHISDGVTRGQRKQALKLAKRLHRYTGMGTIVHLRNIIDEAKLYGTEWALQSARDSIYKMTRQR